MKKLLLIALLSVNVFAVTSCGEKAKAAPKYQCPMQCEGDKTYDKPGKCPECGMEMKEVKEDK
ncbi:MAG TPA: heavy metal-binding domain-containing protein [Bacteroidia bacterium]|nr:heavy metal-binding domain-containing protein [Bacteroidia bacterium]